MNKLHILIAVASLLVASQNSQAADIFVNNVLGDDLFNGLVEVNTGTAGGPVRTVARALRLAGTSDRIILANTDQPYREMISLSSGRHQGTENRPFTIVGNGAILDGTRQIRHEAWKHVQDEVFQFRPRSATYFLLYVQGKPALRHTPQSPQNFLQEIPELGWTLDRGEVYFRLQKQKLPASYEDLRATTLQTGITLYHVRHVRIENLVVQGFSLDGINAHDSAMDCTLVKCTLRGNGRSGLSVGGASRVVAEECLIGDNGVVQVRTEGHSITRLENTVIVDNTGPAFDLTGGQLYEDGKRVQPGADRP